MPEPTNPPASIPYGILCQRNPERVQGYLERLWAFYDGGIKLLGNSALMREVMPRHRREADEIYQERLNRAFYIGISGAIVDYVVSTLMSDPIRVGSEDNDAKLKLSKWYATWISNVAPKGAPKADLVEFIRQVAINLLVTKESWVRVDLPLAGDYASRGDQEKAGALDAWLVNVPTECVWDWKTSTSGELEWAVVHSVEIPREAVTAKRDTIVERWYIYDRFSRQNYKIAYKADDPPDADKPVLPDGQPLFHKLGSVPLIRKVIPSGLWAMDTLESPQREYFNKRNAVAWGEVQSLLPELYEFKGPEVPSPGVTIGQAQKDPDRDINQNRGQGFVQRRGADDRAEFVGPPTAPFTEGRQSCAEIRDEMYRVLHLMAMSVSNSASMLGRSAASKAQDQASTAIVCGALGRHLREHAAAIMEMVSKVRSDKAMEGQWRAQGAAQFVITSIDDVVERALKMETVTVKSPTFKRMHQAAIAESVLGEEATPSVMKQIEDELAKNITDEDMAPGGTDKMDRVDLGKPKKEGEGEEDEEGNEE